MYNSIVGTKESSELFFLFSLWQYITELIRYSANQYTIIHIYYAT